MKRQKGNVQAVCVVCGAPFLAFARHIRRGRGKCCSHSCAGFISGSKRTNEGAENPNWKGGLNNKIARYKIRNPEKYKAHRMVHQALKVGFLVRCNCEICGEIKSEAHHEDYSKPLDVRWLCKKHHLKLHRIKATA